MKGQGYRPISTVPFFGPILRNFDEDVGRHGFHAAFERLLTDRAIGYSSVIDPETARVLGQDGVLLIVDHEHDFEMVPLYASLPHRHDSYLVAAALVSGIGPNTARHILPVYVRDDSHEGGEKWGYRAATLLRFSPPVSDEEARRLNRECIQRATHAVNHGGLVMLFPSGTGNAATWKSGVGFLVDGLVKDSWVVYAHVEGTTSHDSLRLIPGLQRFFPSFTMSFSRPMGVGQFQAAGRDPREITRSMEAHFNEWRGGAAEPAASS